MKTWILNKDNKKDSAIVLELNSFYFNMHVALSANVFKTIEKIVISIITYVYI